MSASHFTLRKRILLLLLLLAAAVCVILFLTGFPFTPEKKFDCFTRQVFCEELSGNTLSLHYTVANPSGFGLENLPISLGDGSTMAQRRALAACENYRKTLDTFSFEELNASQQVTYAIFKDWLDTELSGADFLLYEEPLGPALGIQAQLPILLAEYSFRTKGDIENYLSLLTQVPDYFLSLLSFEREKAVAGLFMSDACAQEVIRQCQDFIQSPSDHYLITLFQKKIDAFSNLSVDEKIAYQKRNEAAITGYVLPAYETLIKGLTELLGKGRNEQGLFYFPKGQAFYEYLVKREVGDTRSIAQIEEEIKQQLVADYQAIQNRLQAASHTTSASSQPSTAAASVSGLSTAALPALTFLSGVSADPGTSASFADDSTDAVAMLKDLRKKISQDFPGIPAVSCEVKYIDDSLKDYLSPAFYLTPPIDQYTENVIYLNPAENCRGLSLYTTLAHEGYPGHLFQTVSFHAQSPAPLRFLLAPGGYTEGWATYVEMYAYSLWDGGSDATVVQQKNRAFSLGLAALLDIGIHYHGYSLADVSAFLTKLGFNASGASSLYQAILQAPANYLQYYVGYLNFQRLRSTMQQALQEHFVLREFHTAVLDAGPAPFSILEKLVAQKLGVTVS